MSAPVTPVQSGSRIRLDSAYNRGLLGKPLSAREVRIVELVADGRTNPEIGTVLGIAMVTVKAHICTIMRKMDARDRANMVALAFRRGILAAEAPEGPSHAQMVRLVRHYGATGAGRRLRERLKVKQLDVARLCGVSVDAVRAWETGSTPPGPCLADYARILDCMARTGQLPESLA